MRKNTLLIAVAATALAVGSGTAFAQGAPQHGGQKSDSPAAQSNPASKNAPAEKIQGQGTQRGSSNRETTGQGASEHGQKMGQGSEKSPKSGTTGQAPSEPKAGQANERRDNKMGEEKTKSPNRMGEERNKNENRNTTGQAPSQQQTSPNRANEPNRMNSGQTNERGNMNERGNANENRANENRANESTSTRSSTSANLSTEQRTKIHSIIVGEHNAPRVAHVDFNVSVGTVVPRGSVRFVPLPSTIVEIEPSWRGYEYFLVGDQIVVVDPATLRIVAVLPA